MLPPLTRRLLFAGLPTLLIATVAVTTIWGEHGLLQRHALERRLEAANVELATVERENQRLLRELSLMERDPVVLERVVAEELGRAREGSTLYRFP